MALTDALLIIPEAASIPAQVASCKLGLGVGAKCVVGNCLYLASFNK